MKEFVIFFLQYTIIIKKFADTQIKHHWNNKFPITVFITFNISCKSCKGLLYFFNNIFILISINPLTPQNNPTPIP